MVKKSVTQTTKDFMDLSQGEHPIEEVLEKAVNDTANAHNLGLNGKEEYLATHPTKPNKNFCPKCGLELRLVKNVWGDVIVRSFRYCDGCGYWKDEVV